MSETLARIQALAAAGNYRVSHHAYQKLEERGILATHIVSGLESAVVVETYPDAARGPTVLLLMRDQDGEALHALWGIPGDRPDIAVLITAYRPDPRQWTHGSTKRITP